MRLSRNGTRWQHRVRRRATLDGVQRVAQVDRRLVREALSQVFAKSLNRVELEVFASNAIAIGLYEREGFVIEGRKRGARFLDGVEDDILIMGCLRDEWPGSTRQETAAGDAGIAGRLTIEYDRPGVPKP